MDLLVSVRSADEAEAALAGGAALIDVKEPARGSLGRADDETVAAVVRAVAGRRPVSAALGEILEGFPAAPRSQAPLGNARVRSSASRRRGASSLLSVRGSGASRPAFPSGAWERGVPVSLAFAKWGLAGCRNRPDWAGELTQAARHLPAGCRPVAVAYADWRRADAPSPAQVCAFVCARRWGAFLIDTWRKDGTTLPDWMSPDELNELRDHCRAAGMPIALAGSLGLEQLRHLRPVRPDWFAVRGAACRDGQRTQTIDADRVRRLVDVLAEPVTPATRAG